jgi:hypothetical protein
MFGVDVNINMSTIDLFLNRPDVAYFDMRMLVDPANFEAIGGISNLTRTLPGFRIVPMPFLATMSALPPVCGDPYFGDVLFRTFWTLDNQIRSTRPNFAESELILNDIFPKNKPIFLMCGGAGYAALTRTLLIHLGWDPNLIYNIGGNWSYTGRNSIDLLIQPQGILATWRANYAYIDFGRLTPIK